jgi:hypothetical protein
VVGAGGPRPVPRCLGTAGSLDLMASSPVRAARRGRHSAPNGSTLQQHYR